MFANFGNSRRHITLKLALATSAIALMGGRASAITSADNGTFKNDNTGYIRQPSSTGSPITVFQNGAVGVGFGSFYPHSTIIANDGTILDTSFANLLTNNLGTGNAQTQDSLLIHMAQCFSGGFVDEVDDNMFRTEINTASWWGVSSYGTTKNSNNAYSNAWYGQINAGKNMKDAYSGGVTNDPFKNQERPQYYSTSNTMDSDKYGQPAFAGALDKKYAILFVGTDLDGDGVRAKRHYNDAVNYYNYLKNTAGYAAGNIYVYYHNGTAPAGAGNALPIDGAATVANFNGFFNNVVKNNVAGQDDQVAVWVSDHGGLANQFKGRYRFVVDPNGNGRGKLSIQYKVGSQALSSYVNNPDGAAQVMVDPGGMEGFDTGEKFDVVIKDPQGDAYDIGSWDPSDEDLNIPTADLAQMDADELGAGDTDGDITVELTNYDNLTDGPAYSGDYSDDYVDDIAVDFNAFNVVPEPGTFVIGASLMGLGLLRRRRAATPA